MSGFIHWLSLVLLVVSSSALISPTTLPRNHRRRSLQREAPKAFFGSLFPNPEADQRLDDIVKRSKAVLLSDGSAASTATKDSLKAAKVGNFIEVRLDQEADSNALIGALRRRVGTQPPTLIVFDRKRIEYLINQDMMLPVFRAAGTSGELRLPFQDLRFYLSKTVRD